MKSKKTKSADSKKRIRSMRDSIHLAGLYDREKGKIDKLTEPKKKNT